MTDESEDFKEYCFNLIYRPPPDAKDSSVKGPIPCPEHLKHHLNYRMIFIISPELLEQFKKEKND